MDIRATTASTRPYYVLVDLANAQFVAEITAGTEVDWVTNAPEGCTVKVNHGHSGGNSISDVKASETIAYLSITPSNASVFLPEYVNIHIPSSFLTVDADVYATAPYRMQISPTPAVSGVQSVTKAQGGSVTVTLQDGYKFSDSPASTTAYAYSFNNALFAAGNARYDFNTPVYAIPVYTWTKVTDSTATITFGTELAGTGSTYEANSYYLEIMLPAGSIVTSDGAATTFTPSTVGTGSSTSSITFSASS